MSLLRSSLLLCVLPGCIGSLTYFGPPGDDDRPGQNTNLGPGDSSGSTADTGQQPTGGGPIHVFDADPPFGSSAGGQEIRLTGAFDVRTEVRIGGADATVVSRTADALTVLTPPSTTLGAVDVQIRSTDPTRSDTLAEGFEYFEDASGQAGIIGMIGRYDVQGDYWTEPATDFASASVAFVDGPSDWEFYQGYASTLGSCTYRTLGYPWPDDPVLHDVGTQQITFQGDASSFVLDDGAVVGGWYTGGKQLQVSDLRADETYDLRPMTSTTGAWPSFVLPDALQIPDGFTLSTPYLDTASLGPIPRQASFEWTGSGGDYVLVQIRRVYTDVGGKYEDRVTCGVPDNGSFTLPISAWPDWFAGDLLYVQVGRVVVQRQTLPHNHAENRVAGIFWIYGAGLSQ